MPKERTTWLTTSAREGSTPIARMISAGTMVTRGGRRAGSCRRMKPCITTWPASVPTLDDDEPRREQGEPEEVPAWPR